MTRGVVGIVLATFFSDVGHEMVTAVLPMYLSSIALGAAALGVMEGLADFVYSLSKLGGGWLGHHTARKRAWGSFGYLVTAIGMGSLALVHGVVALVSLRSVAWIGRGVRSPLRDFMLSDEVPSTHFGRAYGVERAADMLGAVIGPLIAAALVWAGFDFRTIILISIVPAGLAAVSFYSMTKDRTAQVGEEEVSPPEKPPSKKLPRRFWIFTGGVALFGIGDFSRTFLILLAAAAFGETGASIGSTVSVAVLLYALHNAVSSIAAYPAGLLGDLGSKPKILTIGYALGVVTNVILALAYAQPAWLVVAIVMSGIYYAIEETVEKASAAELLPREQRAWGLGVLASANAVGDMVSSLFVGIMISTGNASVAFFVLAGFGLAGTLWMASFARLPGEAAGVSD